MVRQAVLARVAIAALFQLIVIFSAEGALASTADGPVEISVRQSGSNAGPVPAHCGTLWTGQFKFDDPRCGGRGDIDERPWSVPDAAAITAAALAATYFSSQVLAYFGPVVRKGAVDSGAEVIEPTEERKPIDLPEMCDCPNPPTPHANAPTVCPRCGKQAKLLGSGNS
jgi:hypothetical protein